MAQHAQAHGLQASMSPRCNCRGNACAESFLAYSKKNGLDAAHTQPGKLRNPMCSIILNCFTIQHDDMEITVTCRPWSLKITILGTKRVSRKMGAYQKRLLRLRLTYFILGKPAISGK